VSEPEHPSPIIDYFVRELRPGLPAADQARLDSYADRVAATTHHGDFRRAWHCAGWAIELAEASSDTEYGRMVEALKEKLTLWKDTIFGAEFGAIPGDHVGPGQDVEIQWVDDAVAIATDRAEAAGWATVPWEDVLEAMLEVAADGD
jgi:hypothetical protein